MKRIIAVLLFNLLFFVCIFADGKNPEDPRTATGKPESSWNKQESTLCLQNDTADFTNIDVICGDGGIAAILKTNDSFNIITLTP